MSLQKDKYSSSISMQCSARTAMVASLTPTHEERYRVRRVVHRRRISCIALGVRELSPDRSNRLSPVQCCAISNKDLSVIFLHRLINSSYKGVSIFVALLLFLPSVIYNF